MKNLCIAFISLAYNVEIYFLVVFWALVTLSTPENIKGEVFIQNYFDMSTHMTEIEQFSISRGKSPIT